MPKQALTAFDLTDIETSDVLQLVFDYQRAVAAAVAGLERQAGTPHLLAACHAGRLPRRGRLADPQGTYAFHGVGCRFEIARRTIDVDFGPDGRHDGFDAWRLGLFAASAFEWQHLASTHLDSGLAELQAAGVIHQPAWEPSPHLLYLAR